MSKDTQKLWLRNHVLGLIDNIDAQLSQIQRVADQCKMPAKLRRKLSKSCAILAETGADFRSWAITANEKSKQLNEGRLNADD